MRKVAIVVVAMTLMGVAYADLQNVQVGGLIEMRGRWISDTYSALGAKPQANGVTTPFAWDESNEYAFFEETTSLNVKADFTEHVNAFIEFYSYLKWGDGFRSDYVTGVDSRPISQNAKGDSFGTQVLQAYIETNETFGQPLTLRIGRQCMSFGKKFLISDKTTPTQRLSFDAIRATYKPIDKLTIDAWVSKLFEGSPTEEDGDVDFYGIYATYAACDEANASLYYMLVRDGRGANSIYKNIPASALDYDPSMLNTVGGRFWGAYEGFDYTLELAYQFGNADAESLAFANTNNANAAATGIKALPGMNWDNIGFDGEVGYTFDCKWKPRPFVGGVFYEGGEAVADGTYVSGGVTYNLYEMKPSFNRLFSDTNYCPVVQDNGDMSNFAQVRYGVVFNPLDKVAVTLRGQNLWATETVPGSDSYIGTQLDTIIKYQYSKDLMVLFYYGHLFNGDSPKNGNYIHSYGNSSDMGLMSTTTTTGSNEDADYMFWMLSLKI